MRELNYPFNADEIIAQRKKIRRTLAGNGVKKYSHSGRKYDQQYKAGYGAFPAQLRH